MTLTDVMPACYRLTQQVVALKETKLKEDEGAPFTAIREGKFITIVLPAM